MKLLLRNVRSGKRRAAIADLKSIARKQLEGAMDNPVKTKLIAAHKEVVKDWEHEVDFQARKTITANQIKIYVFPTGPNQLIWIFVDQGTKAHVIEPKQAPKLVFQAGTYMPKTRAKPARVISGGGVVQNPVTVYAKKVDHPGTEAREFSRQIAEDIKPEFIHEVEMVFKQIATDVGE